MKLVKIDKNKHRASEEGKPRRRRSVLQELVGASLKCLGGCGVIAACAGAESDPDGPPPMVNLPPVQDGKVVLQIGSFPQLQTVGGSLQGTSEGMGAVWLVREAEDRVVVASALCTHMACPLRYNALNVSLDCACHGSTFELDGQVINGPAVKPLRTFAVDFDGTVAVIKATGG